MTNATGRAVRRYAEQTYGPTAWRQLGAAVAAVPRVLRGVASRRFARGILALPVAAVATGLTAVLGYLTVINVLAYPFRPYLGLHANDGGSIWASTYYGSWGGPTLAGAWAVHGLGILLIVFPLLTWTVRGLLRVQERLLGTPMPAPAAPPAPAVRVAPVAKRSSGLSRIGLVVGAVALFFGLARLAHAAGIGDNVLWLPRSVGDTVALAVVLAPLAAVAITARTWRRPAAQQAAR
jgi:hypothetical protein